MKLVMLYRPKSEFARAAEEYVHEFERRTSRVIEVVDVDSPEGIQMMELYGLMDHPAFVATDDSGNMLHIWTGKPLPLVNELSAYAPVKS